MKLNCQTKWFKLLPWLNWDISIMKMTCYMCSNLKENQRNKFKCTDLAYVSKGYLNWKKAISHFSDHSKSALHSHAMEVCHIEAITPFLYNQQDAQLKKNNIALKHILTSISFLVSKNIALRGKNTNGNEEYLRIHMVILES